MAKKAKKSKTLKKGKTVRTRNPSSESSIIHVSIQKVLEKMKAIVDGRKEHEFLKKCLTLKGEDRYVLVNPKIVKLVNEFVEEHELPHALRTMSSLTARTAASVTDETCF